MVPHRYRRVVILLPVKLSFIIIFESIISYQRHHIILRIHLILLCGHNSFPLVHLLDAHFSQMRFNRHLPPLSQRLWQLNHHFIIKINFLVFFQRILSGMPLRKHLLGVFMVLFVIGILFDLQFLNKLLDMLIFRVSV